MSASASARATTMRAWWPAAVFLAGFAASRALAAACGLTFCSEHAAQIMHFPELELLRDRLFETVWHLHGQPPGPSRPSVRRRPRSR